MRIFKHLQINFKIKNNIIHYLKNNNFLYEV